MVLKLELAEDTVVERVRRENDVGGLNRMELSNPSTSEWHTVLAGTTCAHTASEAVGRPLG